MVRTRKILFDASWDEDAGRDPLFKSAYDLARYLVAKHLAHGANARTLGNFLAQVLRGDRKLPTRYEAALLDGLRLRLVERGLPPATVDEMVGQAQEAIRSDAEERRTPVALDADELYYELVRRSKTAGSQFIVTERPAEIVRSPRAQTLNAILLNRLGLDKLAKEGEAGDPQARYTFNLPSKETCEVFWNSLEHTIQQNALTAKTPMTQNKIVDALEDLEKSGHLLVYSLPPEMCVYPSVVFDPDAPTSVGFVFYYHGGEDEGVSVARMDPHSLQHWKESFLISIHRRLRRRGQKEIEQVLVRQTLAPEQ